jgi:hypothetical protein
MKRSSTKKAPVSPVKQKEEEISSSKKDVKQDRSWGVGKVSAKEMKRLDM